MRIMEIISGTAVNGAATNCCEIVRALEARGHQVTVVCRPNAWIADQLRDAANVEVILSDLHRWPTDQLTRIAKVVRERKIQIVHTHMSSANFFGVLLRRLFGIPACVATAHNRYVQLHWMFNDRVIAVSEATRRFHQRYNLVRPSRIDVVHNFINDDRFHRVTREQGAAIRSEFGIGEHERLMGAIGDVIPRKGLIHLIRSLPEVVRHVPEARLAVIGHSQHEYATECRAEAERLGVAHAITWMGTRSDIDRVLASLDVYVLPSLEENMPLAILEAMASRLPVVATAVGGIPECITDEQTGLLVPPALEAPLSAALVRLLRDPELCEQLGTAGRQEVSERFSVASQIRQIEQVFDRTAA